MSAQEEIVEVALEAGFDLAGVIPLAPPARAAEFDRWLEAGHHADMDWLVRQRDRITDPRRILPEGRSLLVVGLGHARPAVTLEGGGRVARYAAGRDYHNKLGKLLKKLARRLTEAGLAGRSRAIVDAGPLLERSHAAEAGLGFESKAANLLHRRFGPWFFLGELLLDVELEPTSGAAEATDAGGALGSCGTCTACLDACPTNALIAPGVLNANLCISYHTIENRGHVPHELRGEVSDWAFGCDVCSEVCPWGHAAPDAQSAFGTHAAVEEKSLVDWLRTPRETFGELFNGSALQRPRREGLARNAALALGRHPSEAGRDALLDAIERDPHALVRAAAAWSLLVAHRGDGATLAAVERALASEPDDAARADMARSLREA